MKHLFLSIQTKLAEIDSLKYIDKDWGQLQLEAPPVKFPCALLDIENISYSQMGNLAQMAEATIDITVCNYRLTPSSRQASNREESYQVFDLLDGIQHLLHGWAPDGCSKLIRSGITKLESGASYEIYKMSYKTAWKVQKQQNQQQVQASLVITQE